MKYAAKPDNEAERLRALREYQILDTLPEEAYDDITRIAAEITGTPIALLNLVEENRQWTKSRYGMDVTNTPRELTFCSHAILNPDEMLIVEDARYDERFHDNPLILTDPKVIFYAGVPIVDPLGHAFGTLCVIDNRPRNLPDNKLQALKALANLVNVHLELRKARIDLEELQSTGPTTPVGTEVPDQSKLLINKLETNLQPLLAGNYRPEQAPQLTSIQEAIQSLKSTL
ncbi:hypothetical protein GCM10023189_11640 [Nibrella saemangeumensis]|uniref:GAF domain-containing protein n=1 Tax=Nibrella saemangeumensis TaxID=1084526 RepID=A0ABP8MHQ9_9BACT